MKTFIFEKALCMGIAGNIAGHLAEAGEAAYFKGGNEPGPKGIFPTFLPSHPTHNCRIFPVTHSELKIPAHQDQMQIEPELALCGKIIYNPQKQIQSLELMGFCAYNDLSIRDPKAVKISHKKNWGALSKGFGPMIELLDFNEEFFKDWRIVSWHQNAGEWRAYSEDTAVLDYTVFGQTLLNWIQNQLNTQKDEGQLEDLPSLLKESNFPEYFAIGCGATRYTEWGKTHFVKEGDSLIVMLYKRELPLSENEMRSILQNPASIDFPNSLLKQTVSNQ